MIIQVSYFHWINLNNATAIKWVPNEGPKTDPYSPHFEVIFGDHIERISDEDQCNAIRRWLSTNQLAKSKPATNPALCPSILPEPKGPKLSGERPRRKKA